MRDIIESLMKNKSRLENIITHREKEYSKATEIEQKSEPYNEYRLKTGSMKMYLEDLDQLIDELETVY